MKLDDDLSLAVKKMETMDKIYESLPGLDCGSCGSPNCRTLAEDIVQQKHRSLTVYLSSGEGQRFGEGND